MEKSMPFREYSYFTEYLNSGYRRLLVQDFYSAAQKAYEQNRLIRFGDNHFTVKFCLMEISGRFNYRATTLKLAKTYNVDL